MKKIGINFQFLGDSLTSGMNFSVDGTTWFDFNRHKGSAHVGLGDIFSKEAQAFIRRFNKQLKKTTHLKEHVSEVYFTPHVFARAGLGIAHYNPGVSTEFIPHQMYAPSINTLNDMQADTLLIALGTNDTQDFDTMAVEAMFRLFQRFEPSIIEVFLNEMVKNQSAPALVEKLRQGYDHLKDPSVAFASLMPGYCMSKKENSSCLQALCRLIGASSVSSEASRVFKGYCQDWGDKQYWSKTPDEVVVVLDHLLMSYTENQCIKERGYGLSAVLVLPPTLSKPCIFPSYHETHTRIIDLRTALIRYAAEKGLATIDMDSICKQAERAHGDDNLHLTQEAYDKMEERHIFDSVFASTLQSRLCSVVQSPEALKELDVILSGSASFQLSRTKGTLFGKEEDISATPIVESGNKLEL